MNSAAPRRIQRKRAKGWRMPLNTVYVGRGHGAYGKWGNPYLWSEFYFPGQNTMEEALGEAVRRFRASVLGFESNGSSCAPQAHPDSRFGRIIREAPIELHGKNLACWCPLDRPCHADVLLEMANG